MGKSQTTLSFLSADTAGWLTGMWRGVRGPGEKLGLQTPALVLLTLVRTVVKPVKANVSDIAAHAVLFSVFKCICMNPDCASVMGELFPPTF